MFLCKPKRQNDEFSTPKLNPSFARRAGLVLLSSKWLFFAKDICVRFWPFTPKEAQQPD